MSSIRRVPRPQMSSLPAGSLQYSKDSKGLRAYKRKGHSCKKAYCFCLHEALQSLSRGLLFVQKLWEIFIASAGHFSPPFHEGSYKRYLQQERRLDLCMNTMSTEQRNLQFHQNPATHQSGLSNSCSE